jgi:hypothetical protein
MDIAPVWYNIRMSRRYDHKPEPTSLAEEIAAMSLEDIALAEKIGREEEAREQEEQRKNASNASLRQSTNWPSYWLVHWRRGEPWTG